LTIGYSGRAVWHKLPNHCLLHGNGWANT
jgi:hypothetical protein